MVINYLKVLITKKRLKKIKCKASTDVLSSSYVLRQEAYSSLGNIECVGKGFSLAIGVDSYWRGGRAVGDIEIGRYCSISRDVTIGLEKDGHPLHWLSSSPAQYSKSFLTKARKASSLSYEAHLLPTKIEADVWIGDGATVMNGVTVGVGAIVAKDALVLSDVPAYAVVAGIPAKIVRYRFSEDVISRLVASRWWSRRASAIADLPFDDIDACLDMLEQQYSGSEDFQKPEYFEYCGESSS